MGRISWTCASSASWNWRRVPVWARKRSSLEEEASCSAFTVPASIGCSEAARGAGGRGEGLDDEIADPVEHRVRQPLQHEQERIHLVDVDAGVADGQLQEDAAA